MPKITSRRFGIFSAVSDEIRANTESKCCLSCANNEFSYDQTPITCSPARNRSRKSPKTRKTDSRSRTETSAAVSTVNSPRESHHIGVRQLLLPRSQQKPQHDAMNQRNSQRKLQMRRRLLVASLAFHLLRTRQRETPQPSTRLVLRFHVSTFLL